MVFPAFWCQQIKTYRSEKQKCPRVEGDLSVNKYGADFSRLKFLNWFSYVPVFLKLNVMAPKDGFDDGRPIKSTLGMRYPSLREHPIKSGEVWMESKKIDDGYRDLWRIHDGLYDLSSFIKSHPGGSEWLEWTQGTDITEAFESHHIQTGPEKLLQKFFVKNATTPRDSPFHFKEGGFYRTLKSEVREALKDIPKWPTTLTNIYTDLILAGYVGFAALAAVWNNYWIAIFAGLFLGLLTIAAHNYIHQKSNFRMYYINFSMMSWRQWRLTHALSHHLFTNTINDLEISSVEPFFQYLPGQKSIIYKAFCWIYTPIVYSLLFIGSHIRQITYNIIWNSRFYWDDFLPYSVPLLMHLVGGRTLIQTLYLYATTLLVGSLHFGIVRGNAAHHHPDIFHDGDTPRPKEELDWGIHQMDVIMDRTDIKGSLFLVLTNFGDHNLHHLFPTLDHGKLEYLQPVLRETCKKFGKELRTTTQIELIKGQFKQLLKEEPNNKPPKPLSVTKL